MTSEQNGILQKGSQADSLSYSSGWTSPSIRNLVSSWPPEPASLAYEFIKIGLWSSKQLDGACQLHPVVRVSSQLGLMTRLPLATPKSTFGHELCILTLKHWPLGDLHQSFDFCHMVLPSLLSVHHVPQYFPVLEAWRAFLVVIQDFRLSRLFFKTYRHRKITKNEERERREKKGKGGKAFCSSWNILFADE